MEYLAKSPTSKIVLGSRKVTTKEPRWVFDKGRTPERTEGSKPVLRNKDAKSKLKYITKISKVNRGGSSRSKGPSDENTTLEEKEIATIEEKSESTKATSKETAGNWQFLKKYKGPQIVPRGRGQECWGQSGKWRISSSALNAVRSGNSYILRTITTRVVSIQKSSGPRARSNTQHSSLLSTPRVTQGKKTNRQRYARPQTRCNATTREMQHARHCSTREREQQHIEKEQISVDNDICQQSRCKTN